MDRDRHRSGDQDSWSEPLSQAAWRPRDRTVRGLRAGLGPALESANQPLFLPIREAAQIYSCNGLGCPSPPPAARGVVGNW
jgi:hypothetical protein